MYTPNFIKRENQFTNGNEYMLTRAPVIEGESIGYIGYYNITAEGPFTDRVYTQKSKPLYPIKIVNTVESSRYVELITANFYKGLIVKWKIVGPKNDIYNGDVITIPGIEDTNKRTLIEKEFSMNGISLVLSNRLLQYSEYDLLGRETNTDIQL